MVCVAAGRGERFGGDKLSAVVADTTVLELSLTALHTAFPEAALEVVVPPHRTGYWRGRVAGHPARPRVVAGGMRRQDSVRAGVEAVDDQRRRGVGQAAAVIARPRDVALRDVAGSAEPDRVEAARVAARGGDELPVGRVERSVQLADDVDIVEFLPGNVSAIKVANTIGARASDLDVQHIVARLE